MFQSPTPTAYDLNFEIFNTQVRVHPLFWLIALLFGSNLGVIGAIIWMCVMFISILIHELGHVFAMRRFGVESRVVLYGGGGLAIPTYGRNTSPQEGITISAAGPFAGFIFAGILMGAVTLLGGSTGFGFIYGVIPIPFANIPSIGYYPNLAIRLALYINVFWGLINLLPVFPLDGGQIARYMFVISDPWEGVRKSLQLSIITAIIVVVLAILGEQVFIAVLFGFLAFSNYQMLVGGSGRIF